MLDAILKEAVDSLKLALQVLYGDKLAFGKNHS